MTLKRIVPSIFLLFLLILSTCIQATGQEKRLALLIGNKNYNDQSILYNTVNDANSMELVLEEAGFEVIKQLNARKSEMDEVIQKFGKLLKDYDVGLFFFAGHGIQVNGQNYLIPVDALIKDKGKVVDECVSAQVILNYMEEANAKTNIIILDACRQNPFARSWSRSSSAKGLAPMNAPAGSIIAFATAPGKTASDGQGKNGLYTGVLLRYMQIPDLKIEDVFKRVRSMVREKSGGSQIPWENILLEGDFYFHSKDESVFEVNTSRTETSRNQENPMIFTDPRDNQEYEFVEIGDQVWMVENLNYKMEGSWCYSNSDRYCRKYGRIYSWEAAQVACPSGWKLPSDYDWMDLENFLGMSESVLNERDFRGTDQGDQLKREGEDSWVDDEGERYNALGFSVLPAGNRNPAGTFHMIGRSAFFYTSTSYSEYSIWGREIRENMSGISRYPIPIYVGTSVRCLKTK